MAVACIAPPDALETLPTPPVLPQEAGRCSFIVPGKNRRCRFTVVPGLDRCGAHREDGAASSGARIPCPLDPSHSVYEQRLLQHLKVCTRKRDEHVISQQPFYRKGANLPCNVGSSTFAENRLPVSCATPEVAQAWMDRISAAYPSAVLQVLGQSVDPESLLAASIVEGAVDVSHAEKHDAQNQALANLAVGCDDLPPDTVVVEYGCGRGGLAAAVLSLRPGLRCVLVERETRRHKFENRQESREERVLRLRLDIADFDFEAFVGAPLDADALPKAVDFEKEGLSVRSAAATGGLGPAERLEALWRAAASLQAPPWPPHDVLACAKHLCGGATDVALRTLQGQRRGDGVSVCVATCCHHRCDAVSYVNASFLRELGLYETDEDFAQFVSTAGWAVGGQGTARDIEKRRYGMMAKRILDLGRVAWLQQELGLQDARIVSYIGKDVTPENIAIVAGRSIFHE